MRIPIRTVDGVETFISQITSAKYEDGKLTLIVDTKEAIGDFVKDTYEAVEVELTTEETTNLLNIINILAV
jgi:hypothetical protein